jgi:hypothetical protein
MKHRVVVIFLSGLIGWAAGIAALSALAIADSPGWYLSHPLEAMQSGVSGSVVYALLPILFIACTALALPARISTVLYAGVAIGWLALIFGWWAYHTVSYDGAFPWWGFRRQFLFVLPAPLSGALAFALSLRRMLAVGKGNTV